jgi:hypothetical protein
VILVEQYYVLAMLYFSTSGEGWGDQLNFTFMPSVCDWNKGFESGVFCNEDDLVVDLNHCKSKHEEAIVFIP